MRKLGIISLIFGILLLFVWGFFYFFSGKMIYQSDQIKLDKPVKTFSEMLQLSKQNLPYKATMYISYKINGLPDNGEYDLFSYTAVVVNENGKVIHQITRSLEHIIDSSNDDEDVIGSKFNTVDLATIKEISDGYYTLAVTITRNNNLPKEIELRNVTIEVKEKVVLISWLLPVAGLVVMLIGAYILQLTFHKKSHINKKDSEEKKE